MSPAADTLLADGRPRLPGPEVPAISAAEDPVAAPEPRLERRVAASRVSTSANLLSFGVALLSVILVVLVACAIGLLIAATFYDYGGLG